MPRSSASERDLPETWKACPLTIWGEEFYAPDGRRSILTHEADGGLIDQAGRCADCQHLVGDATPCCGPGSGAPSVFPAHGGEVAELRP